MTTRSQAALLTPTDDRLGKPPYTRFCSHTTPRVIHLKVAHLLAAKTQDVHILNAEL